MGPSEAGRARGRSLIIAVLATVLMVGIAAFGIAMNGGDATGPAETANALVMFSRNFQMYETGDYTPLRERNIALPEVLEGFETEGGEMLAADIAGAGVVTDVRWGATEVMELAGGAEGRFRKMYVVIHPDRMVSGSGLVGQSGDVIIELSAPPSIQGKPEDSPDRLAPYRSIIGETVAFFLVETDPREIEDHETRVDDINAGRGSDDRIFVPVSPGTLFGIDGSTAMPLLVNEHFDNSGENFRVMESLGLDVDRFSTSTRLLAQTTGVPLGQ